MCRTFATSARAYYRRMLLLFCTDETYARPLAVALHSTLARVRDKASAVIVLDRVSDRSRQRLQRSIPAEVEVSFVDARDLEMGDLKGDRHITAATYLRLFADQVMPPEADRVLFLDADVLALADVAPLYRTDMRGNAVAAVRDMVIADSDHPYSGSLTTGHHASYFNAGVLLIDLARWRANDIGDKLREYVRARPGHGNFDQDALNDVLRDDWLELDPVWNVQGSLLLLHEHPSDPWVEEMRSVRPEILREAAIVHFSGSIKPWQARSRHPYRLHWRRELRRSRWSTHAKYVCASGLQAKSLAVEAMMFAGRMERRERIDG
jgi:lipopolysaccharide biosynthesis glycosyltransferase